MRSTRLFCCDFTNTRCTNNSSTFTKKGEMEQIGGALGSNWRHGSTSTSTSRRRRPLSWSSALVTYTILVLWDSGAGILHSPHNLLPWTKAPGAGYQTIRVPRTLVTCTALVLWDSGIRCSGNFCNSVILVTGYQRQNIRVPCGLVTQPILSTLVLRASGSLLLW